MTTRRVRIGSEGYGANLDVITLSGLDGCGCGLSGAKKPRGLWSEVYGRKGIGWPAPGAKRVSWKPVGKGCKCRPRPSSSGVSKKEATRTCKKRCAGKRKKR